MVDYRTNGNIIKYFYKGIILKYFGILFKDLRDLGTWTIQCLIKRKR